MGRRRCAARLQPFSIPPQERVFFLRAGQRNPEAVVGVLRGAVVAWIDHVQQVPLDGLFLHHNAVDLAQSFRFGTLGQKLQSPDAVPTNGREKIECVGGASFEPDCDTFANGVTVRQQPIEVMRDAVPIQRLVMKIERQRQ